MPERTPINRGFSAPRDVFLVNPQRPGRTSAPSVSLTGAPQIGRRLTFHKNQPYPDMPKWWQGPVTEWIVFWYLTDRKHYVEGRDFYYQAPIFVPYLFQSRDFTRADFIVDLGPLSQAGQIGRYTALVFDPITAFTHPDPQFDKDRRTELDKQGYLLIFMEGEALKMSPKRIIDAALVGRDLSSRATL